MSWLADRRKMEDNIGERSVGSAAHISCLSALQSVQTPSDTSSVQYVTGKCPIA